MSEKKGEVLIGAVLHGLGSLGPAAISLITTNLWWGYAFASAYSLYAATMYLKQEEINEIAQFIKNNPTAFRTEIVKSKEFQDGFLVLLEDYLKIRIRKKREILKQIFLGFTVAADKDSFELERMDSSLERMSIETLEFLILFQEQIRPKIESDLQQKRQDMLIDFTDRSPEWHHDMALVQEPIFDYISVWQEEHYSPMKPAIKTEYGLAITDLEWPSEKLARAESRYKEEQRKIHESLLELDTLGIVEKRATGGSIGAANSFFLTRFGIRFLKYFNEAQLTV